MNKSDLISAVATKAGISKESASKAIEGYNETIISAVKKGDMATIKDFGTYYRKEQKERPGHNPATGEKIVISARNSLAFRPASSLKTL